MSDETLETPTPSPEGVDSTPAPAPEAPAPEAPAPEAPAPETSAPTSDPEPVAEPETPSERTVLEASEYTIPEGLPTELGTFANEHGLTQKQLDATISQYSTLAQAAAQAEASNTLAAGKALITEWGDQAKHKMSLAKRALSQNDPSGELKAALDSSGFGNHPAVLKFLSTIGQSMQEGGYLKSAVNRPPGKKTAAQAMYGDNHPSSE